MPDVVRWLGRTQAGPATFFVGMRAEDADVTVDLEARHLDISGPAGSGKTGVAAVIAAQALDKGWEIVICEAPNHSWLNWTDKRLGDEPIYSAAESASRRVRLAAHVSCVEVVPSAPMEIRDALRSVAEIVAERRETLDRRGLDSWESMPAWDRHRPVLVVVDAWDQWDARPEPEVISETENYLSTLIIEGPRAGVHVVLISQRVRSLETKFGPRATEMTPPVHILCGPSDLHERNITFGALPEEGLDDRDANGRIFPGRAFVEERWGDAPRATQLAFLGRAQEDLLLVQ